MLRKNIAVVALGLLAAFVVADATFAKSPNVRLDRNAICAHFEQAGHRVCPDYEMVRSDKSGEVLIPAILSGALSSVPIVRDGDKPNGSLTTPVQR